MKTQNIIALADKSDSYNPTVKNESAFLIPLFKHDIPAKRAFDTNAFDIIKTNKLVLSNAANDLLNLAVLVYTSDQLVSRSEAGYLGWSRHFIIHMPVCDLKLWKNAKETCEEMLSYLSGDKWEIVLRQKSIPQPVQSNPSPANVHKPSKVVLFSGGLDSFIGVIDEFEQRKNIALVSHYKGGGSEAKIQTELVHELIKNYNTLKIEHFQFYMQPNQSHEQAEKENSSRARSFLFLCLGIVIANSYSNNTPVIIPENGLISLNIPLTATRIGSHSTRTTHPYYISLFNKFLVLIGMKNYIQNPYQLMTKGEMIQQVKNPMLFKNLFSKTMSCAHPDYSRWLGASPNQHCGNCVPCIIRRASTKSANVDDKAYVFDVTDTSKSIQEKGSDFKAFKIAIQKQKSMSKDQLSFHVLSSGPIPTNSKTEFQNYVDLYKRGMTEIENLIK